MVRDLGVIVSLDQLQPLDDRLVVDRQRGRHVEVPKYLVAGILQTPATYTRHGFSGRILRVLLFEEYTYVRRLYAGYADDMNKYKQQLFAALKTRFLRYPLVQIMRLFSYCSLYIVLRFLDSFSFAVLPVFTG